MKIKNYYSKLFYSIILFLLFIILSSGKYEGKEQYNIDNYKNLKEFIREVNKNLDNYHYNTGIFKYFKKTFGLGHIDYKLIDIKQKKFFNYYLLNGKLNKKNVNFYIKSIKIKYINTQTNEIFFDTNIYPVNYKIKTIEQAIEVIKHRTDRYFSIDINKINLDIYLNSYKDKQISFNETIFLKKGKYVKNIIFKLSNFYVIDKIFINNKSIDLKKLNYINNFYYDSLSDNLSLISLNVNKFSDNIEIKVIYHFDYKKAFKTHNFRWYYTSLENKSKYYFHIFSVYNQNLFYPFIYNNLIQRNSLININFHNNTGKVIYSNLEDNINKNIKTSNISLHFSIKEPLKIKVNKTEFIIFNYNNEIYKPLKNNFNKIISNFLSNFVEQLYKVYGIDYGRLSNRFYIVILNQQLLTEIKFQNYKTSPATCEDLNVLYVYPLTSKYLFSQFLLTIAHELTHYINGYKINYPTEKETYATLFETLTTFIEYSNYTNYIIKEELKLKKNFSSKKDILLCIHNFINNLFLRYKNNDNMNEIPVIMKHFTKIPKYFKALFFTNYLYYLTGEQNFKKFINLLLTYPDSENLWFEDYLSFIKQSVSEEKYRKIENFIYEMLFTDSIDFEKYAKPEEVAKYIGNIFGKSILEGVGE